MLAEVAPLALEQVEAILASRPMAISLWQPWATLIALGFKRYETRHWQTSYRGDILIHAAKKWDTETRQHFNYLMNAYPQLATHFPGWREPNYTPVLGAYVCVATLTDIDHTEELKGTLSSMEQALGDFRKGRFGWLMTNVRPFVEPFTAKGQQGIWQVMIESGGGRGQTTPRPAEMRPSPEEKQKPSTPILSLPADLKNHVDRLIADQSERALVQVAADVNPYNEAAAALSNMLLKTNPFHRDHFLLVLWCAKWESRLERLTQLYVDCVAMHEVGEGELTRLRDKWYLTKQNERDDVEASAERVKNRVGRVDLELNEAIAAWQEADQWLRERLKQWLKK